MVFIIPDMDPFQSNPPGRWAASDPQVARGENIEHPTSNSEHRIEEGVAVPHCGSRVPQTCFPPI